MDHSLAAEAVRGVQGDDAGRVTPAGHAGCHRTNSACCRCSRTTRARSSGYTFLSQIFDYGNTDIEKRAVFFRRLVPLLDFGRERHGIDLSKVVLTHHALKARLQTPMILAGGDTSLLPPIEEAGSGQVRERMTAYMAAIIEKLNDLFNGELTDQDKLVYVNDVLMG